MRPEIRQRDLPYGIWKCADGREILFIAGISQSGSATPISGVCGRPA